MYDYSHYLNSRHVAKFEDLVSLFIADHVKSMLPGDCLKYVLSVENTTDVGWLQHRRLAEIIDTYIASHSSDNLSQADISHVVNTTRHKSHGSATTCSAC